MTDKPPGGTERLLIEQARRLEDAAEAEQSAEDLRITLLVRAIVREQLTLQGLTEEEHAWVRAGVVAAQRRGQMTGRIMESVTIGLVLSLIGGIGLAAVEYARMKMEALGLPKAKP